MSPPSSTWSWPREFATPPSHEEVPIPGSFAHEDVEKHEGVPAENTNGANATPKPQRYYPPRTCRICLEVVLPSFELAPDGVSSMFNPTPTVSYTSSDPALGRLIRPCKCSGSSRYVHEGCLQAWRHADPAYGRRNYWECPTCKFRYRLERLRWGRWISSPILQILLTVAVLFTTVFVFGFIADPIINLYLDPLDTITSIPSGGPAPIFEDDDDPSWAEHLLKGLASLGLLGFVKVFFAMSPWHWWNLRQTGVIGGRGRGRGATGRDRLQDISWSLVLIGVVTFLYVGGNELRQMNDLLTYPRLFGHGFELGAKRYSRRPANELQTYKEKMMTSKKALLRTKHPVPQHESRTTRQRDSGIKHYDWS